MPVDQVNSVAGSAFSNFDDFEAFDDDDDEDDEDDDLMMTANPSEHDAHDADGDEVATAPSEHGSNADEAVASRSEQDVGDGEVTAVQSQHDAQHDAHGVGTNALIAKLTKRGQSGKVDKGEQKQNMQSRIAVRFLGERDAGALGSCMAACAVSYCHRHAHHNFPSHRDRLGSNAQEDFSRGAGAQLAHRYEDR